MIKIQFLSLCYNLYVSKIIFFLFLLNFKKKKSKNQFPHDIVIDIRDCNKQVLVCH